MERNLYRLSPAVILLNRTINMNATMNGERRGEYIEEDVLSTLPGVSSLPGERRDGGGSGGGER